MLNVYIPKPVAPLLIMPVDHVSLAPSALVAMFTLVQAVVLVFNVEGVHTVQVGTQPNAAHVLQVLGLEQDTLAALHARLAPSLGLGLVTAFHVPPLFAELVII